MSPIDTFEQLRLILEEALQLGPRASALDAESALLGYLPELDSMAVVEVVTRMEQDFGITIHDDEVNAETFATFGALADFVLGKMTS